MVESTSADTPVGHRVQPAAEDADAIQELFTPPAAVIFRWNPPERMIRKRSHHRDIVTGACPGAGEFVHSRCWRGRLRYEVVTHVGNPHGAYTWTGRPVRTDSAA